MQFLIVDDHPVMRLGLAHLLLRRWPQATISEAETIAQALDWLARHQADLVLVDLSLPDSVGVDGAARVLRAARQAPVLVVSQNNESTYAPRLIQMGARGYVPKDRAATELTDAVERVLAGGRYASAALAEQLLGLLGGTAAQGKPHEQLSTQELRVLQLIAAGRSPARIAEVMNLSVKTVGSYRARLMAKGGWHSTAEMSKYCLQHGLTDPD
jgi:two-component system, NarL family, invasion response regulator UvrY